MKILVVDVGGTHIKVLATGQKRARKLPSGPNMSAEAMAKAALKMASKWTFDVVSIGFPGPVLHHRPVLEPHNLGKGWVGFDFEQAFGKPVHLINDAAMQALGSYQGGRMLFLGLGTGLGSALIVDGVIAPLELAHLPYKKGKSYEHYLGAEGLLRLGKKKWRAAVSDVCAMLKAGLQAEDVVLGGGAIKHLKKPPPGVRLGDNANAFIGGYRMWMKPDQLEQKEQSERAWRKKPVDVTDSADELDID